MPEADRAQDGFMGLLEAISRFDPSRGVQFRTYASWWVRARIWDTLRNRGATIRVPRRPWVQGIRAPHVGSLSAPLGIGDRGTFHDLAFAPDDTAVQDRDECQHALDTIVDPRGALRMRYLLGMRLHEIGTRLGVTPERARQLVAEAIAKTRRHARKLEAATAARRQAFLAASRPA